MQEMQVIEGNLKSFNQAIDYAMLRIERLLADASAYIDQLHSYILTEKAVANAINMFKVDNNKFTCTCWVKEEDL